MNSFFTVQALSIALGQANTLVATKFRFVTKQCKNKQLFTHIYFVKSLTMIACY